MPKSADEAFAGLSVYETILVRWIVAWRKQARDKQLAPDVQRPNDPKWKNWKTAGYLTGRSFGKTLLCSNWIGQQAALTPKSLSAVIGPTHDDVRQTLMFGPTGLLAVIPEQLIKEVNKSLPSITLWNDSVLRGFAADSPERLRGPQHHFAWMDEVGSFMYPEEALYNMRLGLRLGTHPRFIWSTTPRPKQAIKQLVKDSCVVITGSVYENIQNLPESYMEEINRFVGTKIGKQELFGEILDPEELGIVKRSDWRLWPHDKAQPAFEFIIMSIDSAMTEKTVDSKTHDPDFSACNVWGLFQLKGKRHMMLLDAWQDRLGLNDLILKVKKERQHVYGDTQVPAFRRTAFEPLIHYGNFGRPIDMILIEQQGAGRPLVQMLASENIHCYEYNPGRADKLQRLHMVSPLFVNGRVWAIESEARPSQPKSWAEETISQTCSYAGKGSLKHDDCLDACTQALRYFLENFSGPLTVAPAEKKADDIELVADHLSDNPYSA